MPAKNQSIKQAIESVMGSTRKSRKKIIRLVQKQYPYLSSIKIRRVYVKEGFSQMKKPRKRIKNNPTNSIMIPLQRNEEWAIDFMSDLFRNGRQFRTFNVVDHL